MKRFIRKALIAILALAILVVLGVGGLYIWLDTHPISQKDAVYSNQVRYIAHRGLSSQYYQNTRQAFEAAAQSSFFYGIETDVWLTKDGKWVCCHDKNPFQNPDTIITQIDYDAAMATPLSLQKKGGDFEMQGDAFLCDFETYLSICSRYGKVAIIEIKYKASEKDLDNLLQTYKGVVDLYEVQFISFHKKVVDYLISYDNSLTAQRLVKKRLKAIFAAANGYNVGISEKLLTKSIINKVHKKKGYVNVWTVNDKALAQKYADMGADFITTDYIF